jgi:hypothetical protein
MTSAFQTYLDFAGTHLSPMPWNLNLIHQANLFGCAGAAAASGDDTGW